MKDVLIAHRGEVAVRVIWACRGIGLRAVAVYSEADRTAPHVFLTDEAYLIGSASSADSCVQIDRILAAAVKSVKDVIHPGYGFFADCVAPAEAVEETDLSANAALAALLEFECREAQSSTWLSRAQDPDGVSACRTTLPSWRDCL